MSGYLPLAHPPGEILHSTWYYRRGQIRQGLGGSGYVGLTERVHCGRCHVDVRTLTRGIVGKIPQDTPVCGTLSLHNASGKSVLAAIWGMGVHTPMKSLAFRGNYPQARRLGQSWTGLRDSTNHSLPAITFLRQSICEPTGRIFLTWSECRGIFRPSRL
jgi:hypothetical protein